MKMELLELKLVFLLCCPEDRPELDLFRNSCGSIAISTPSNVSESCTLSVTIPVDMLVCDSSIFHINTKHLFC